MNNHNFQDILSEPTNLAEIFGFIKSIEASDDKFSIPVRIGFLRNFTVDGIEPYLKYRCLKDGLRPNIIFGNYDMVSQDILDKRSKIHENKPEIIILALNLETILSDKYRSNWNALEVFEELKIVYANISDNLDALVVLNTFIVPFNCDSTTNSEANYISKSYEIAQLNQFIRKYVNENSSRFALVDWERLHQVLGENDSIDYRFWYMSKAPFKQKFLDMYATEIVKFARSLKGLSKKCLVVDCDNTLWGGVVGEDGINGIKLDKHTYPGNIFYEVQKTIIDLHARGIVIALCSKNNEQDVFDVIDSHPYCILKRDHISSFRINWLDKASNIRSIAEELNLGLDSFVFVDDSPNECSLVSQLLPSVKVLQVPKRIYEYPQMLNKNEYFYSLSVSHEDSLRSKMYRDESNRKLAQFKYDTIEEYLFSLKLSINVHEVTLAEVPRVAQLTQKTNQFNLTTQRYSESQILNYTKSQDYSVLSLTVKDKFGDSGLTGVIIASHSVGEVTIDTLLMSCRVLGRKIEIAFIVKAIEIFARKWNLKIIKSKYIKSQKNQQVSDFWKSIGFSVIDHSENCTKYQLKDFQMIPTLPQHISIEKD